MVSDAEQAGVMLATSLARFGQAMRDAGEQIWKTFAPAAERLNRILVDMVALWTRIPERDRLRLRYGPRNFVVIDADDLQWQSNMCAAWLHESCPLPIATECCCTCHGGNMR